MGVPWCVLSRIRSELVEQAQRAGDSLAQAGGLGGSMKTNCGLNGRTRGPFFVVRYVVAC